MNMNVNNSSIFLKNITKEIGREVNENKRLLTDRILYANIEGKRMAKSKSTVFKRLYQRAKIKSKKGKI